MSDDAALDVTGLEAQRRELAHAHTCAGCGESFPCFTMICRDKPKGCWSCRKSGKVDG